MINNLTAEQTLKKMQELHLGIEKLPLQAKPGMETVAGNFKKHAKHLKALFVNDPTLVTDSLIRAFESFVLQPHPDEKTSESMLYYTFSLLEAAARACPAMGGKIVAAHENMLVEVVKSLPKETLVDECLAAELVRVQFLTLLEFEGDTQIEALAALERLARNPNPRLRTEIQHTFWVEVTSSQIHREYQVKNGDQFPEEFYQSTLAAYLKVLSRNTADPVAEIQKDAVKFLIELQEAEEAPLNTAQLRSLVPVFEQAATAKTLDTTLRNTLQTATVDLKKRLKL